MIYYNSFDELPRKKGYGIVFIKNKDEKPFIKKSKTNKLTYQLESELLDNLGTKISYLIKIISIP